MSQLTVAPPLETNGATSRPQPPVLWEVPPPPQPIDFTPGELKFEFWKDSANGGWVGYCSALGVVAKAKDQYLLVVAADQLVRSFWQAFETTYRTSSNDLKPIGRLRHLPLTFSEGQPRDLGALNLVGAFSDAPDFGGVLDALVAERRQSHDAAG